jgi:hypothetical protein
MRRRPPKHLAGRGTAKPLPLRRPGLILLAAAAALGLALLSDDGGAPRSGRTAARSTPNTATTPTSAPAPATTTAPTTATTTPTGPTTTTLSPGPSGADATGLLPDPGFEAGTGGWRPFGGARLERVPGGRSGRWAARLSADRATGAGARTQPGTGTPAGTGTRADTGIPQTTVGARAASVSLTATRTPTATPSATAAQGAMAAQPTRAGMVMPKVTNCRAGTRYVTELWVRGGRPGQTVEVAVLEVAGRTRLAVDTVGVILTGGSWRRVEVVHMTHRPGTRLAVEVVVASGSVLVDDVHVHARPL